MKYRLPALLVGGLVFAAIFSWPDTRAVQGQETKTPKKTAAWTLEEALAQLQLHPKDPYLQYVALQLARRENKLKEVSDHIDNQIFRGTWNNRGRRDEVDLFNIFTGALAVQESLQLDTMRGERPNQWLRVNNGITEAKLEKRRRDIVRLAELTGPTIKSHPWEKMLAGRTPAIDPLAKMVPDDFFFIQFRSVAKLMDLMENGDLWSTHLFNQAYREARASNVGDRLKQQLVIETNPLVKPFYDLVVEEVAITGSDLFVREGTDVTLIFRYKQPILFKGRMDGFLANAVKARKDVQRSSQEYRGVKYEQLTTPDRDVNVFSAYPADNIHVRSNSKAALQRVLDAMQGKTADGKVIPRLGETPEFAYIRTLMPRGAKEEDGLIYLSDPFIRRLVGPQVKLTERRRMLCYNHLRMIGHGAMLYRTETGKPADSLETLHEARCCPQPFHTPKSAVDAKIVTQLIADLDSEKFPVRQKASQELEKLGIAAEAALRKTLDEKPPLEVILRIEELLLKVDRLCACPSGGAYRLAADGMTGICTHHGHAHFLTPNLETPITKVRGDEADEYKTFLEGYNQYWRTFFDPIAIRVQATPERYRLETIVLPLIDNSIYTGMAYALGGKPEDLDALPVPKRNIFSLAVKLNKEALLKDSEEFRRGFQPDFLLRDLGLNGKEAENLDVVKFLAKGIGNQVGLHVYDAVPTFDFNLPQFLGMAMGSFNGPRGGGGEFQQMLIAFFVTSFNTPVYLSIPVQDAAIVDQFGDQLEKIMALAARRGGTGRFIVVSNDFYQVPFKADPKKMMRSFALKFGPVKMRFFWARIGNAVFIASKDFILEDLLAVEKEGVKPQTAESTAHALVRLRPQNWNQALPDYRLGWAENHREACLNNHGPLSSVARAYTSQLGKIDAKEQAILVDRIRKEADRLHQVHFFCPEGGHYLMGPDGKAMTCSVHGSTLAPRQPFAPAENSASARQLERITAVTAALTFLEDGLHAVLTIERK